MLNLQSAEHTKLLESDDDPPLDSPAVQKPLLLAHSWQTNVQGLRGIAIIGVLLFHLWNTKFTQGYLGVDIFFVISGYLMCLLLAAKAPLSLTSIGQFYFRRSKRILPTYLFVILLALVLAFRFISPTDYYDLWHEVTKPLLYIANVPDHPKSDDYFAQTQGSYSFFTHLWSLSVELQFYLFVPLLVFVLHRLSVTFQLVTISLFAVLSFCFQFMASKDVEHMSLFGRVWQFMFGFLAWHLQQLIQTELPSNVLETQTEIELGEVDEKTRTTTRFFPIISCLLRFVLPLILLILLWKPVSSKRQLNRLVVIFTAALNIGLSADAGLLSNRLLVWIGNISYSIYLVHWPIFEWRRYEFVQIGDNSATLEVGLLLILVSVLVGWWVEAIFKFIGSWFTKWWQLVLLIGFLYLVIGPVLWEMKRHELKLHIRSKTMPSNSEKINDKAIGFFENRKNNRRLSADESLRYTEKMTAVSLYKWYCNKSVVEVPTRYENKEEMGRLRDLHCTMTRGTGIKTIVIIGNSHAITATPGILHAFRGVYSNVTLLYRNGCQFVGRKNSQMQYSHCRHERQAILPMLRQWNYQIDIVIFGQAYTSSDPKIQGTNWTTDPVFVEMQGFFSALNEIAREVVIIPQVQYNSGLDEYMKILIRKLATRSSLDVFRTPLSYVRHFHVNTRRRLAAVQCDKCLKVESLDLWCNKTAGFCDSVDQRLRLPFFYDYHHPNLLGSQYLGHFIRENYDRWISQQLRRFLPTALPVN